MNISDWSRSMPLTSEKPADAHYREKALCPERSFIVQAPAGSGKTELLIQRYLCLLGRVKNPEEIAAITFTRKAAAEMRSRVVAALEMAAAPDPPRPPHTRRTWELARAALSQNRSRQWHLTENPGRLRIQTIDALCAAIVRQMPCLSGLGAQPEISTEPHALYRQAARKTLAELEAGSRWSPAMEALIRHLDNQLERLEKLIAAMLARRDQWLRHIAGPMEPADRREILEEGLQRVIAEKLSACRKRLPERSSAELLCLARFAAANLEKTNPDSPICALKDLEHIPPAQADAVSRWQGISDLLLTKNGSFRRQADVRLGFPAPGSAGKDRAAKKRFQEKKQAYKALLAELSRDPVLAGHLHEARHMPDPGYPDEQWQILQALFEILRLAAAHLEVEFQSAGALDFAEVALRAEAALGTAEQPTDLALSMDYRIQHILIDEFQDTSITQFHLLEKLTMGWTPGDGRTFFAVGDPMQSIYGFREAEVGLFLKTWKEGLGGTCLEAIPLSVNFRSEKGIVDWVNESFPQILPLENDPASGAVAYAPAVSALPESGLPAVHVHPLVPPDREKEAEIVLSCIQTARQADPDGTVAILVRSRPHLDAILGILQANRLAYTAVEIEPLKNRPVIQDLLSLTRALSHPADRIAWLAVLRAPWCGMRLEDLHALAGDAPDRSVVELLQEDARIERLSPDGQARAARARDILLPAFFNRQRRCLRRLVEGAWLRLGGAAACFSGRDFEDAGAFLEFLDEAAGEGDLPDAAGFEENAARLFARPDPAGDEKLQVMTIHKAKGLEFDTVILPGLDRKPPPEPQRLLLWMERTAESGSDLLLAPIGAAGEEHGSTYGYIRRFEKTKRGHEDTRLLYVAATRAKRRLHLIGGAQANEKAEGVRQPHAGSLLSPLWPAVSDAFFGAAEASPKEAMQGRGAAGALRPVEIPYIRRLRLDWEPPPPPPDVHADRPRTVPRPVAGPQRPPYNWAGETARRVGTVVHRWLRLICEQGLDQWSEKRLKSLTDRFLRDLRRAGVSDDLLPEAAGRVQSALCRTLADETGRWILSPHAGGACEYALSGWVDGRAIDVVLDRTFLDEKGVRWIVDYKTGVHGGGSMEAFLDEEKARYQEQMECYAQILQAMENRPVSLMLYYPQLKSHRQWMTERPAKPHGPPVS
jgi:ATP-dependent exoDNAse (exonuclease V) beta subunit